MVKTPVYLREEITQLNFIFLDPACMYLIFHGYCCVPFQAIRSFYKLRTCYMILNDYEIKEKWLSFCYESTLSSTGVFLRLSIVLL
jgi:hypothetical protein